jgi:hypothetical protein
MGASPWSVFWTAKKRMGLTGFSLGTSNAFRMSLHQTAASANLMSGNVSIYSSIASQSSGGGVSVAGQVLSNAAWASSAAGVYRFDCDNEQWAPTGSNLSAVRYAVIRLSSGSTSSGFPLCYAALSTAEFNVNADSTLTVQIATTGVFTLT